MSEFSELENLELQHALRDCQVKLQDLDQRLQDEFLDAVEEGRQPYTICPNTAIRADLAYRLCQAIPAERHATICGAYSLKFIIAAQRKACGPRRVRSRGEVTYIPNTETVALNSDQLAALLTAAGVTVTEPRLVDAQV